MKMYMRYPYIKDNTLYDGRIHSIIPLHLYNFGYREHSLYYLEYRDNNASNHICSTILKYENGTFCKMPLRDYKSFNRLIDTGQILLNKIPTSMLERLSRKNDYCIIPCTELLDKIESLGLKKELYSRYPWRIENGQTLIKEKRPANRTDRVECIVSALRYLEDWCSFNFSFNSVIENIRNIVYNMNDIKFENCISEIENLIYGTYNTSKFTIDTMNQLDNALLTTIFRWSKQEEKKSDEPADSLATATAAPPGGGPPSGEAPLNDFDELYYGYINDKGKFTFERKTNQNIGADCVESHVTVDDFTFKNLNCAHYCDFEFDFTGSTNNKLKFINQNNQYRNNLNKINVLKSKVIKSYLEYIKNQKIKIMDLFYEDKEGNRFLIHFTKCERFDKFIQLMASSSIYCIAPEDFEYNAITASSFVFRNSIKGNFDLDTGNNYYEGNEPQKTSSLRRKP